MQTQKQSWIKRISKHEWARRILVMFLFLILSGVVAYIVTPYYFRYRLKKDIGAERYAAIQHFLDSPVNIPDSWRVDGPYSEELIKAQQDFMAVWASIESSLGNDLKDNEARGLLKKFQQQNSLSKEEWDNLDRVVKTYSHLVSEYSHFISIPDYDMTAIEASEPAWSIPEFKVFFKLTQYFTLRAHLLANKGEWQDAFESCLIPMQACVRSPATPLTYHMQAYYRDLQHSCETFGCLARDCDDSLVLGRLLEDLNYLDCKVNLNIGDKIDFTTQVGNLRILKEKGFPITFDSDMTCRSVVRTHYVLERYLYYTQAKGGPEQAIEWIDTYSGFLSRFFLMFERFHQSYEDEQIMRNTPYPMSEYASEYFYWERVAILADGLGYSDLTEEINYCKYILPDLQDAFPIREKLAKAKFDLARLAIAKRIEQLEKGQLPTDPVELCESYFDEPLIDPFSQSPYLWQAEAECFYSVGPDGKNDNLKVAYLIDSGTMSEGDISLLPWEVSVTIEPKEESMSLDAMRSIPEFRVGE